VPIEQFASRAAAIVKAAPDVIISVGDVATRVVREATSTIPIVVMAEDMVAAGLVASLARPGGNVTGISLLSPELDGKRQDILIEAVPGARRIAVLADPTVTPPGHTETLQEAVRARGIEISVFPAARPEAIGPALDAAKASGAEAVNVLATPLFANNRQLVIERVAALRLPAIYQWPEIAERAASQLMALAFSNSSVSERGSSPRFCAAPSQPRFPSSSRPISSLSLT
jgi:putative ABC transport system substrate-binding protein